MSATRTRRPTPVDTPPPTDTGEPPSGFRMLSIGDLLDNPDNLRAEATAIPGLVDNLRSDGIPALLQPIVVTAHPETNGYLIIDGHNRVLSFREASRDRTDLTHIPAIVRTDLATRAAHLVTMLRTATQRVPLSSVEQARGIQQLALEGLSQTQIARRTGYRRAEVTDALAVARLDDTTAAQVLTHSLNLTEAAVLSEFTDDPDTVGRLLVAAEAGPLAFDKAAVRERHQRDERQRREERRTALVDAGVQVLDEHTYPDGQRIKRLADLAHNGEPLTPDTHATCPGHAVSIEPRYGDAVHEVWCCTDWRAHRHTSLSTGQQSRPLTTEQKAERRQIIDNNRAMRAANEVRRHWLAGLFARRSAPKTAARYVATTMINHPYFVGRWMRSDAPLLDELLGADRRSVPASASDSRCVLHALAAIAAAHEYAISHETWRHPDADAARWLSFCVSLGYDLDPVERLIVDTIDKANHPTGSATTPATTDQPATI